jgi:hypothetical protein
MRVHVNVRSSAIVHHLAVTERVGIEFSRVVWSPLGWKLHKSDLHARRLPYVSLNAAHLQKRKRGSLVAYDRHRVRAYVCQARSQSIVRRPSNRHGCRRLFRYWRFRPGIFRATQPDWENVRRFDVAAPLNTYQGGFGSACRGRSMVKTHPDPGTL